MTRQTRLNQHMAWLYARYSPEEIAEAIRQYRFNQGLWHPQEPRSNASRRRTRDEDTDHRPL